MAVQNGTWGENWLGPLVEQFWTAAGGEEPFPRSLESALTWALPAGVFRLAGLRTERVNRWLARNDFPVRLPGPNQPLHGCLLAYAGVGTIFVDAEDSPAQQRFSLAHEAAHFMLNYLRPRQQAVSRLGRGILEVLDGLRPPTLEERIDGLLAGLTVGVHTHLCLKNVREESRALITGAEQCADRLALELLAPASEVWNRVGRGVQTLEFADAIELTTEVLVEHFGLPADGVAGPYARFLVRCWRGGPSVREWLGLSNFWSAWE